MKRSRGKKVDISRLTRISFLPSVFTVLNLFFGFTALLHILKSDYERAITWIILAVIMDGLDGTIARLTKTESNFGVQLDSLVDGVTFGVVPAFLIYHWGFLNANAQLGKIVAFVYLSAGIIRLARFNVYKEAGAFPSNIFIGLPIPGGALSIGSFVLLCNGHPLRGWQGIALFSAYALFIAFLMISNIQYRTMKKFMFKNSLKLLLMLAVIIACLALYPNLTLPIITGLYIVSPLFLWIIRKVFHGGESPATTVAPTEPAAPAGRGDARSEHE